MYNLNKMLKMYKDIICWSIWVMLVVLWNYGFPNASPLHDVLVAIALSIIFILIKKLLVNN